MHRHTGDHRVRRQTVFSPSPLRPTSPSSLVNAHRSAQSRRLGAQYQTPLHNGKQTVISRFQAASPLGSALLSARPRLWGGAAAAAAAVGFNKSIVFASCLKGLGFILEPPPPLLLPWMWEERRAIALGRGGGWVQCHCEAPPRSGAYCLIVSIYNVFARGCFGGWLRAFSPLVMRARVCKFLPFLSSALTPPPPPQIADAAKVAEQAC